MSGGLELALWAEQHGHWTFKRCGCRSVFRKSPIEHRGLMATSWTVWPCPNWWSANHHVMCR